MNLPRILHIAPANTSGVPGQFVQVERQLGYDSRLVTLFADPRNYFTDLCLDLPFIDMPLVRRLKRLVSDPKRLQITTRVATPESIPIQWRPHGTLERLLVNWRDRLWRPKIEHVIREHGLDQFDVYQLDGGLGFYRHSRFIQKQKNAGKRIICCYTGSDLRTRGVIPAIDAVSDCNVTVEFDHLELHPNITHVGFPFDSSGFARHEHHDNTRPVRIGHAPTNRAAKGSDQIIPVLEELQQTAPVEIVLIEGMSYKEALEQKLSCDIFVDQIGDLGYGINGLEAFAMEIPVASCLAPGFTDVYPHQPFIDVNSETLKLRLLELIENPERRRAIGRAGREWVQTHHDAQAVVQRIHELGGVE